MPDQIQEAIDAFNNNPNRSFDDFYGKKVYHYARRAILATNCDYEIVTVSGVRGCKVDQEAYPQ